ncbi:hypothetical protein TWF679_000446 [Orbilia oligospora]|uniref:Branched-chain amino acid aminotransferase n=1 Tax=Orbilia oligospora TaxID=2813651 RepID=A0A8H8VIA5_ORBOL|nr:hypothetical protein TWF679_000446 [Orbilia oligospora]
MNYGQQCYEGLKAFRQKDGQIRIFRPEQNALRMQHSASFICLPEPPVDHFLKCVHLAVANNAAYVPPYGLGAGMYIRPLLFATGEQLGLNPPTDKYTLFVYVIPTGVYHGTHPIDALILDDFDRAAPQGTGSAKVGGNYAPVFKHAEKAKQMGYGITLHLDAKIINSCIEIAKFFGWNVEYRPVHYDELSTFNEVVAAGTAAALVPIKSITQLSKDAKFEYLQEDEPGPMMKELVRVLKGVQQGNEPDTFGWCQLVSDPNATSNGH